jgi:hypothetical protein
LYTVFFYWPWVRIDVEMPYFPVPITGMQYEMSPNRDMIHLMLNQLFSGGAIAIFSASYWGCSAPAILCQWIKQNSNQETHCYPCLLVAVSLAAPLSETVMLSFFLLDFWAPLGVRLLIQQDPHGH